MKRALAVISKSIYGVFAPKVIWDFIYECAMWISGVTTPKAVIYETRNIIEEINALEPQVEQMTQEQMIDLTNSFKDSIQSGKSTFDEILPMAFAMVREASKRTLKMRHFDVQLMGGIILHRGMIAEMCTGEGKTLVSTLPAYLNALSGKGVYIVTVNDYLAQRDSQLMGQVHEYLGLTVGCVTHQSADFAKQQAYHCDITYATNNELGFDYLRDHMELNPERLRQRQEKAYAIVDEVDSIMIDEARTPLIISGPSKCSAEQCAWINTLVKQLTKDDYDVDEKHKSIAIKQTGIEKLETILRAEGVISENETLYISACADIVYAIQQSIKAHSLYEKDVDYIVKDGEVLLIDEFTGRVMDGRRYSEGLHQAIEAKEDVEIKNESVTLASITYQNYFRMYNKLAGMTGTAATESEEFQKIYNLLVVPVPTHMPILRNDRNDLLYKNSEEKLVAICNMVQERHAKGQPILIGTSSVEKSEEYSHAFRKLNIAHNTLNARYHEQEAQIIADAGRIGAVTIATNMAGRGTDIKLGGTCEQEKANVIALGGLFVIGTERNDSRRIDNQLRGRAGRQGDPGESVFCISPQDRLIRIFAGADKQLEKYTADQKYCEPVEHAIVNFVIRDFQRKIESQHFDERKHTLEYDSVLNEQRKIKDSIRESMLLAPVNEIYQIAFNTIEEVLEAIIDRNSNVITDEVNPAKEAIERIFNCKLKWLDFEKIEGEVLSHIFIGNDQYVNILTKCNASIKIDDHPIYEKFIKPASYVRQVFLQTLDAKWQAHLNNMENLKQHAYLQSYAQKDPLNVYKNEAFPEFESMMMIFKEEFCNVLSCQIESEDIFDELNDNEVDENPMQHFQDLINMIQKISNQSNK